MRTRRNNVKRINESELRRLIRQTILQESKDDDAAFWQQWKWAEDARYRQAITQKRQTQSQRRQEEANKRPLKVGDIVELLGIFGEAPRGRIVKIEQPDKYHIEYFEDYGGGSDVRSRSEIQIDLNWWLESEFGPSESYWPEY